MCPGGDDHSGGDTCARTPAAAKMITVGGSGHFAADETERSNSGQRPELLITGSVRMQVETIAAGTDD